MDFTVTYIEVPEDPNGDEDFLRVTCQCGVTWDLDAPHHETLVMSWWKHLQTDAHRTA